MREQISEQIGQRERRHAWVAENYLIYNFTFTPMACFDTYQPEPINENSRCARVKSAYLLHDGFQDRHEDKGKACGKARRDNAGFNLD